MIKTMMAMFFFFSILSIPAIYMYSSNNGLEGLNNYYKARYSVGNFGFSGDFCRSSYVGLNKAQTFTCSEGRISKLNNFGIIPTSFSGKAYCGFTQDEPKINACNAYIKS